MALFKKEKETKETQLAAEQNQTRFRITLLDTRTVFVVKKFIWEEDLISFKKDDIIFGNFQSIKDEIPTKHFNEVTIPISSILFIAEVD